MLTQNKHKREKLICDQRAGCVAVYKKSKRNDTIGCSSTDERNIVFSNKNARFDIAIGWTMDEETQTIINDMVNAYNEKYRL